MNLHFFDYLETAAEVSWKIYKCGKQQCLIAELQIVNESTKQPPGILYQHLRLTMQVI